LAEGLHIKPDLLIYCPQCSLQNQPFIAACCFIKYPHISFLEGLLSHGARVYTNQYLILLSTKSTGKISLSGFSYISIPNDTNYFSLKISEWNSGPPEVSRYFAINRWGEHYHRFIYI